MNSFGKIKTKILGKLTESYSKNNKSEIKDILKLIKNDNDFKELYLFYEEIEKISLTYPGSAELYLETVEPLLIEKTKNIEKTINKITTLLENVEVEDNELYDLLDVISEKTELKNLDKKVVAKKKLVDYLKTDKTISESHAQPHTTNENLLYNVLVNNFNAVYDGALNEEQKSQLKDIMSLSFDDLTTKTNELKESINNKIENILNESSDDDLKEKLNKVKGEVNNKDTSRLNYFKLIELKNGLD